MGETDQNSDSAAPEGDAVAIPQAAKASDLPVRVASAAVMLAVAGGALWAGGDVLRGFIAIVAVVCLVEFVRLVPKATASFPLRVAGMIAGTIYIGLAALGLAQLDIYHLVGVLGVVIFTDTFAYFTGRTVGGPKIAPRISPSKTWAGLLGGMAGSALWLVIFMSLFHNAQGRLTMADNFALGSDEMGTAAVVGVILAVAAQAGDFLESWLKRKAGVKDSSNLIPGHGGVFDRVDGLLPVALLAGLLGS